MTQSKVQIRTLKDLQRYRASLYRKARIRKKILNARLKKFEQELTIPNITRELFRGSKVEWLMPTVANYLSYKVKSGKDLLSMIGGFFAGFGSIFSFIKRQKQNFKDKKQQKVKNKQPEQERDAHMFI